MLTRLRRRTAPSASAPASKQREQDEDRHGQVRDAGARRGPDALGEDRIGAASADGSLAASATAARSSGEAAASCSLAGATDGPPPPGVPPPAGAAVAPVSFEEPLFDPPFVAAESWARAMMSRQLPYWSASAGSVASASRYSFCV